ncbi:hypothetical protein FBB35_31340 [Nostoc sp. TCL240-02]|nr:hypothetical protein FBB35_31340 [Nostoc sp. TCL240-02]
MPGCHFELGSGEWGMGNWALGIGHWRQGRGGRQGRSLNNSPLVLPVPLLPSPCPSASSAQCPYFTFLCLFL